MATQSTEEAYDELLSRIKKRANIGHAQGVLGWDQQVMMPEGGAPARSKQISTLSSISHEILTDERSGELLDQLDNADLNEEQRAIVREFRRQYDRAVSVPQELVEEISETSSDAQQIWQDAKQNDDFEHFAPTLETLIELHTERAEHIDSDRDPYVVMYEDGSPYLPLSRVETIFDELREGLVPLIEEIKEDGDELASPFEDKTFDEDAQMDLAEDTLDYLGYDWDHGRLDTSPHPFTSGNQYDARVTTRFNEDEPLGSLMATIHEYGHATYQLGLSKDDYATPL
ncbi:MAG: carboxypeptidase M32, partial [Halobacteriaceae archaeon]